MSLKQYRVWHDRPACISCGACAAACPENWEMDRADDLASVKELAIDDEQLPGNEEAAMLCPVNIIHIAKEGEVPAYFAERGIHTIPSGRRDQ